MRCKLKPKVNLEGPFNKLHKVTLEHKSPVESMFSLTCFKCMLLIQAIITYGTVKGLCFWIRLIAIKP
jgi:hypothetical protein